MFKIFLNAIMAGVMIGMAGTIYLSVPNQALGAFLFGFGLLIILCYEFKLFTGAIGYVVNQGKATPKYIVSLVFIWLGNLAGTALLALMVRNTRFPLIAEKAAKLADIKLHDSLTSIFILSVLCGLLMYIAVESYRSDLRDVFRFPIVFLCVGIFILSGYEHCIANMFYFCAGAAWSLTTLVYLLVMTLGNTVGGIFIPCMDKIRK